MTAAEPYVLGFIALAYIAIVVSVGFFRPKLLAQRATAGVLVFSTIALVQLGLVLNFSLFRPSATALDLVNYGYVIEIGLLVGGTEMISRYRDDPFAPLVSTPGLFYILINGGAAALAYYLMGPQNVRLTEPIKTLVAGVGAMAFFRSGVFTARVGSTDIPVGPNLVLQVVLQALDRAYDRQRAVPRSNAVTQIMRGVSFNQVKVSLPTLCFDLMQNVTAAETAAINSQVSELSGASMSDDAKLLSLGLALINVVGEDALEAAVKTLGSDGFLTVGQQTLLDLAAIDPKLVNSTLPRVCEELPSAGHPPKDESKPDFSVDVSNLTDESRAVLLLYKLAAYYGEPRVKVAIGVLATQQTTPQAGPTPAANAGGASATPESPEST